MVIQVRDVQGVFVADGQNDNQFSWEKVFSNIEEALLKDDF